MDRALLIELTTYGFLHAGMAPLHREVLKRSWPFLPGNTLYGALAAALIRLEGPDGVGPSLLVNALVNSQLRFTPLLPDMHGQIQDILTYSDQAQRLAESESGHEHNKTTRADAMPRLLRYQTTPHAPLSRRFAQIQGSQLYAVECHQPEQRYRGWIFCDATIEPWLRKALNMLPFLPLGGKGKFMTAEAQIVQWVTTCQLKAELAKHLSPSTGNANELEIEMVTPIAIQGADIGLLAKATQLRPKPPRRYRVWRTGIYPDQTNGSKQTVYGVIPDDDTVFPIDWRRARRGFRVGEAKQSVAGLPEGSRFTFSADQITAVAEAFVQGLGRSDWAALGWGQLFVRRKLT